MFLAEVVDYLENDLTPEDKAFRKLVKWYFKLTDVYTSSMTNESAREELLKLKEIKSAYQRGIPFIKNITKGQKKGFNFRYKWMLETMLKQGENEEALKYAQDHLIWIRKYHSERSYYRHKKEIINLGIKIEK